ncbi:peptide chain release factor N(5)-glutamine methyltransferase [Oricola sp.]|uniref:peptide chain release factor N(5)-glutamine methyltransferase n=1 Tax=Oricola sp. TaxID=1979950 RepID=UPI0025EEDE6D|nr:peptide chain release factor N(5)-glutamine methyltransferase [Oricola sp.]MCI5075271.1 peptide chain release factor N(5)-glutamine methyltransferase [Oricola sp.]
MSAAIAPHSVSRLFDDARKRLSQAGFPTPDLDAGLLLEFATGATTLDRITDPGKTVDAEKAARFEACLVRRLSGEPAHRILGEREFYGLPLKLNASTLVPRPDTETLVDLVLPFVRETAARTGACRILDVGTGSGAIALALLAEVPEAVAIGTDVSEEALDMADANAAALGLDDRFGFVLSNWFEAITDEFDLIVSNPPYIRSADIAGLAPDVRDHDPMAALDGGTDGLSAYRVLASQAPAFLAPDGALAVEIGYDQKADVTQLFAQAGMRLSAERADYAGNDRALFFIK